MWLQPDPSLFSSPSGAEKAWEAIISAPEVARTYSQQVGVHPRALIVWGCCSCSKRCSASRDSCLVLVLVPAAASSAALITTQLLCLVPTVPAPTVPAPAVPAPNAPAPTAPAACAQLVETEHLFKALLEQPNGLARRIMSKAGLNPTQVRLRPSKPQQHYLLALLQGRPQ